MEKFIKVLVNAITVTLLESDYFVNLLSSTLIFDELEDRIFYIRNIIDKQREKVSPPQYMDPQGEVLCQFYILLAFFYGINFNKDITESVKRHWSQEEQLRYQIKLSLKALNVWLMPSEVFLHYLEIQNKQTVWFFRGEHLPLFDIIYLETEWFQEENRSRKAIQKWIAKENKIWEAVQAAKPDHWFIPDIQKNVQLPEGWIFLSSWADYKQAAEAMVNCLVWHYWANDLPELVVYNKQEKIAVVLDTSADRKGSHNQELTDDQFLKMAKMVKEVTDPHFHEVWVWSKSELRRLKKLNPEEDL